MNRCRAKAGAALLYLLFIFLLPISEAEWMGGVSEAMLPNGLKVILLENHKAPVVTFQV